MLAAQLNRYLAFALKRSPRALELCSALDGKRLRIEIEGLPGALCVAVAHGVLHAAQADSPPEPVDSSTEVTVRGSPLGLMQLAGGDASGVVMRGSVSLVGEESLAQQFQELARLLRPTLEAAAAQVVGPLPAHLATRAFTLMAGWGRSVRESVTRNATDYLAHESRDLVPRAEAEGYFSGVEALRSQVTRAEARIAQLAERLATLAERNAS
ncbi:MAG TPA: SCP2 sterol-binding domain-containing protein [Steroidobacteraceae bacterium]|nr:SCP2 sterol-binding domain-containing protein [Steroidobacteraceae bacterium]